MDETLGSNAEIDIDVVHHYDLNTQKIQFMDDPIPMKLPNAERAIVEIAKIRDYSLDATHEEGKHKARVFAAALGIGVDDADWLREKLLDAALRYECVSSRHTPHGQRYVMDFSLARGRLEARVRSVWNIRPGETAPRLITCYVL